MLHIAENIRLIRLLSGMTQEEFGVKMGANKNKQYTYEKGLAEPDELYQQRVSDFAGVSIKDLMSIRLKEKNINVIDPDTKDMMFTLATKTEANQHDVEKLKTEAEHLRELLKAEKEKNELLKQLVQSSSKKS